MTSQRNDGDEPLADAARKRAERENRFHREGLSTGRRLAQIGVLGWLVVIPTLGGALLGRWIDGMVDPGGIFFTAPLLILGLILGCYIAWNWVNNV